MSASSDFSKIINLDRLMQFATELVVPIADAASSLSTALSSLSTQVDGIDDRVTTLENTEYEFYVDLTTGNLMYEKTVNNS